MEASLLVLAAGMGSRYGGLKQLDSFGPNGETIIDYSIYDALNAGFTKIVFVVRRHFREEFESYFRNRIGDRIQMEFVEQELDKIPQGFEYHNERSKPWGTAHAVLMGKEVISEPFAVINADDYYGQKSYATLIDYFGKQNSTDQFVVVSYLLANTLSDHGTVNRGVCYQDQDNYLTKIVETLKIGRNNDGVIRYPSEEKDISLADDTLVSMNMFGFFPNYFDLAESYFKDFLKDKGQELTSEFYIPFTLDNMIKDNDIRIKILTSPDQWFGVTYRDDKPIVMSKINDLIQSGIYPEKLWD